MILAALLGLAAPEQPATPSFPCTGTLTPTETLICGDPELSAYDHAMGLAWSHKLRPMEWTLVQQRGWIARRNACGSNRACVIGAYREWIGQLVTFADTNLPLLSRDSGRRDPGNLIVQPVGGGWYLFVVSTTHLYDPHDRRGQDISDAEQAGLIHLSNGTAHWSEDDSEAPTACTIDFRRRAKGSWELVEGGICGGLNAFVSGIYS